MPPSIESKLSRRPHHSCLICNIFSALLATVIGGPLAWWGVDRQPAYNLQGGTAHLVTIRDATGASKPAIDIVWDTAIVLREGCTGTYNREVEDSIGHIYTFKSITSTFNNMAIGVHRNVHSLVPWELPDGINEGQIKMRSHIQSICNPIQMLFPVHSTTPDVTYTVTESPIVKKLGKHGILGRYPPPGRFAAGP